MAIRFKKVEALWHVRQREAHKTRGGLIYSFGKACGFFEYLNQVRSRFCVCLCWTMVFTCQINGFLVNLKSVFRSMWTTGHGRVE